MSKHGKNLRSPPWLKNTDAETRCVGIELEMSGFDLDALANHVAGFFHLTVSSNGRYERKLLGDSAGEWGVELDYELLKRLGREDRSGETLTEQLGQSAEDILAWAAENVAPLEIVSPPLPLDRLEEVDGLIDHLREAGAKGSSDSVINTFGLQLNPDLPSHEPDLITACLKSFLCLYDWLYVRADIDFSRRIAPYVKPFPTGYVKKVLAPDYWPGVDQLIDDYLAENPTRNRALDMLPLFMFIDKKRVRDTIEDVHVKARPTLHYRLPDCNIHEKDWGLAAIWNDWIEVEYLADDKDRLKACCEDYLDFLNKPVKSIFSDWADVVEKKWRRR